MPADWEITYITFNGIAKVLVKGKQFTDLTYIPLMGAQNGSNSILRIERLAQDNGITY